MMIDLLALAMHVFVRVGIHTHVYKRSREIFAHSGPASG